MKKEGKEYVSDTCELLMPAGLGFHKVAEFLSKSPSHIGSKGVAQSSL